MNTINSFKQGSLLLMRFTLDIKYIVASNTKFSDLTYETLLELFSQIETDNLTNQQQGSNLAPWSENSNLSKIACEL